VTSITTDPPQPPVPPHRRYDDHRTTHSTAHSGPSFTTALHGGATTMNTVPTQYQHSDTARPNCGHCASTTVTVAQYTVLPRGPQWHHNDHSTAAMTTVSPKYHHSGTAMTTVLSECHQSDHSTTTVVDGGFTVAPQWPQYGPKELTTLRDTTATTVTTTGVVHHSGTFRENHSDHSTTRVTTVPPE